MGLEMKAIQAVLVATAAAWPLAASAQSWHGPPHVTAAGAPSSLDQRPLAILEAEDADALRDGRAGTIELAARVVTRVGPRGHARTFVYRGRPLAVIRRPAFIYPPGLAYRAWAVGAILPAALFASTYYFLEWQSAGLRQPAAGTHWVRHGPDLLLVDDRTGRVIEVVRGAVEEG